MIKGRFRRRRKVVKKANVNIGKVVAMGITATMGLVGGAFLFLKNKGNVTKTVTEMYGYYAEYDEYLNMSIKFFATKAEYLRYLKLS